MFRRKQDVDRHVASILARIKEERAKHAKGYQIARLYFEVKEFETARRYLANFLNVRETVPQAYRLLGQIEEAVGNKENAVEAYKRFLELGGQEKEVVLKICELYLETGVEPGKGKYWLERAEQLFPRSDVVFRLKERLITATQGPSKDDELEKLITTELLKKPQDVQLRIKLLHQYLAMDRCEEAYTNALETDRITAFASSLEWYECLLDVFKAYQAERDTSNDAVFMFHHLAVLSNLTYLRLCHKDVVESAEALHYFDLAMQAAVKMTSPNDEWDALVTEMQGQLFFLAGTLLLKRAQKGSFAWNDIRPWAAVFYLLCQTVPTIDAQATWFVRPTQQREKMYAWMYKNSFFRISQSGHALYQLCQEDPTSWVQRLQQQCCTQVGQERVFKVLFTMREIWACSEESYLKNTHKFCNTSLNMPPRWQLLDVDRVAHTFHPESLSELVWLCLQQYTFGDPHQPDYNFKMFEMLPYSVKNMENGAPETLCQLDTEAFLYATVRCAALQIKELQVAIEGDIARPAILPLCLCKKLCTPEQEQWWHTVYNFCTSNIKDNFAKMRHVLQRGLEVVRLLGMNHGMSTAMVVHLAKTFDSKVKSLKEGNQGICGSTIQLACLEARAAFYWKHTLTMLTLLEKNQRGPSPKMRLFDDGDDADLDTMAIQELLQDAKFASAVIAMREGHYEEAIKGFEKLTTPWASFYRAQIYKALAQQAVEGGGSKEIKRQRYMALITQARDALYLTMDHLGGDKNHELNILLTREVDDVESKLLCFDWENENRDVDDIDDVSGMRTPVRQQNGHSNFSPSHSTPETNPTFKSVRQRLIMSELTNNSPLASQRAPGASPSTHLRPSPERLDAQIKSINYSQSQLFKTVLDRNEELIGMYHSVVEELQGSNRQLKTALGENSVLMEQLKKALAENKEMVTNLQKELAETAKQMKDEMQVQAAVAAQAAAANPALLGAQGLASQHMAAGYFVSSPYQQQYPPYGQPPPHLIPPGTNYRYPLLPGYPAARPAQPTSVRLSERPGGTAPSSFGKFRSADRVDDEEEEEENSESLYGLEYAGEDVLPAPVSPYYMQPEAAHVLQDFIPGNQPVAFPPQTQPAIPQPGYFASALRGQALQYAPVATTAATSLPLPGPGFFSSGTVTSGQSAIATALSGKSPVVSSTPQQIPVIGSVGTGAAKPAPPISPILKPPEASSMVVLYQGEARFTTLVGETPSVDVRVVQDTATKQGSIMVTKKGQQDILANHSIAGVKIITSFNPNYFLWSITSQNPEKKMDETFRLSFDNADQTKKLRAAVEQVIKTSGLKPSPSLVTSPAFAARSPSQIVKVTTPAVVSTPGLSVKTLSQSQTSTATSSAAATTTTPSSGARTTFGGFTFSGTPVVKTGETSKEEKPKASPQFKLKESTMKVTSPTATASTTTATTTVTSSPSAKPFAGFTFMPPKSTTSVFGTATSTTTTTTVSSGPATSAQTFIFGQGSIASALSFTSMSSAQPGLEAFKPSSGGFASSTQPMFQKAGSPQKSPGGKDDETVEEYEPNVDFQPVIELPELVEVKTGEEDETKIFAERVRLFRFDLGQNQWKERGVGELKILQSKGATRFRILMRREQVLKVCANHYISTDMKLTPLSASDRAWCYAANDFAEEEMKIEKFAVKFKTSEKAQDFRAVVEDCQKKLALSEQAGTRALIPDKAKDQPDGRQQKSLSEMFKPAEGSWECSGCLVRNTASVQRCPACQTLRPGLKPEDVKPALSQSPFAVTGSGGGFGGFKISGSGDGHKNTSAAGGFKFGATAPAVGATSAAPVKSLSEMFKPAEGSWECPGCLVCNNASFQQCPACETLKPGVKPEDIKPASTHPAALSAPAENPFAVTGGGTFGGFKLGATAHGDKPATTGFKFGTQSQQKTGETTAASSGGGFKFTFGEGSGFKFGTASTSTTTSSTGFVFGGGAASTANTSSNTTTSTSFVFGSGVASATSTGSTTTPPTGFVFGGAAASTAKTQTIVGKEAGFVFGSKPVDTVKDSAGTQSSSKGLLEQLLTSDDAPKTQPQPSKGFTFGSTAPTSQTTTSATSGFSFKMGEPSTVASGDTPKPSGFQAKLGQVTSPTAQAGGDIEKQGFQFTFSLKSIPQKSQQQLQPTSPKSPETDEQGFYLNKEGEDSHIYFEPVVPLPEKIQVKTGEEDETILFENRAKLYRFVNNEWKERGVGVFKILHHKQTGRIRVLMRRDQVLKICCNHYITPELDLKPMPRSDGKAWIWFAMDFAESNGKMEQLAVRFRDADIACNFKRVFDESKEKMKTPSKVSAGRIDPSQAVSHIASPEGAAIASRKLFADEDDDVIFLYEAKPTAEQIERARKLMLPDTFYLYENRPGCPGCIGCEDYDRTRLPATQTQKVKQAAEPKNKSHLVQESLEKSSEGMMFGNLESGLSFSALAAASSEGSAFGGNKDPSKPFHWSGAGQKLFGGSPKGGVDGGDEGNDGEVAPSEDIHFEPVIPLPELVKVQTGEEDWEALFAQRARVYRFDGIQWKERGVGEMKIMRHKEKLLFRVLLRREQVLKVACNHLISTDMTLKPMATSETAWCWVANDYTESEPRTEQFAVKFKNIELAKEFKAKFEECQEMLCQGEAGGSAPDSTVSPHSPTQETMTLSTQSITGDQGNPCYTRELNMGVQDTMSFSTQPITGDCGNPYYTQQLNVLAHDSMSASTQLVTGDRGNPYYSRELNIGAEDTVVSSTQSVMGDRGNPYYSRELDVAGQDATITSTSCTPLGAGSNPVFSQLLDQQDEGAEDQYDDYVNDDEDDDYEDDDEETTEEEEEKVEFEKRVTLFNFENNEWKKLGLGNLRVLYDEDLNGNRLNVVKDDSSKICNHVICMEHGISVDKKSCEWQPLDFSTDEPVRRHFKATFSSSQSAEEFADIFRRGQKLAVESELSEKLPEEIDVPEIFSAGDKKGAAQKP